MACPTASSVNGVFKPTVDPPETASDSILKLLNYDVLLMIFKDLFEEKRLVPLSMTCTTIRHMCMPILFSKVNLGWVAKRYKEFPRSLWPYVEDLTVVDTCPDMFSLVHARRDANGEFIGGTAPVWSGDPLLCGNYNDSTFDEMLSHMPNLCALSMVLSRRVHHGLPWHVLETILAVPRLQALTCETHLFSPRLSSPGRRFTDLCSSLTAFRYILPENRHAPRVYPAEVEALGHVLEKVHQSLEVLVLPLEPAPLPTLSGSPWPALRELKLYGELVPSEISLFSVLKTMPALRVIELLFSLPEGVDPQPLWSRELREGSPWPDLEELTISFPCTDDDVYAHLPSGLRALTLRYFPHLHDYWESRTREVNFTGQAESEWHHPRSNPSDLLRILGRCNVPGLKCLEVEYHADDGESSLLSYLGTAFPTLSCLTIRRYRAQGEADVDLHSTLSPLQHLGHLRELRLYLDMPLLGHTDFFGEWDYDLDEFRQTLDETAERVAPLLPPSIRVLKFYRPASAQCPSPWAVYRILQVRSACADCHVDGEVVPYVRAEYDSELSGDVRWSDPDD